MKKHLVMKSILVLGIIAAICYYNLPQKTQESYVFSLKGEPLCKYTLERYNGIHVEESTKTIIATDVNNDQPIVRFTFG